MSRATKMAGATAAVAAGPSGIKRVLAGCLMLVLLGGLLLGALLGFAAWLSARSDREPVSLPCPPATVAVAISTQAAPASVRKAVETALREADREPVQGGWGAGLERDLVVAWTPGAQTRVSSGDNPTTLILGAVPSAAEVTEALGPRLAPCEAEATPAPKPDEAGEPAPEAPGGFSWPWQRDWSATGWASLAVGVWWLAGPNVVRWGWAALWPVRLGWRTAQRSAYRCALRRGVLPREWPERVTPGQRWHESAEAMHDHRMLRSQTAESEDERRAALRDQRRTERLEGLGLGAAALWRLIYRVPAHEGQGAPEKNGVSP